MTTDERIELLKSVAECAPREMRCTLPNHKWSSYYVEGLFEKSVTFHLKSKWELDSDLEPTDSTLVALGLVSDIEDAEACFAMLDAMEKAGWFPRIGNNPYKHYWCSVYDHTPITPKMQTTGTTRAEAISKAFVAVFGGKE